MKILHLVTSSRGTLSFSTQLGNAVVERLQKAHPGSITTIHDLTAAPLPYLEEVHIHSFFTPAEDRTAALVEAVKHSDAAIAELFNADAIIIDVPMYNFGIPSVLKSWIDHIARSGKTFTYNEKGPEGLVRGKKIYLAIATGGVYSDGPMKAFDFTESYLRPVLGFLGMTDITVFRVEGSNLPELKEHALEKAIEKIAV
jgi:FMN-dependent NADH-azoreductase